jgi:Ca2+/Na+ antiporter
MWQFDPEIWGTVSDWLMVAVTTLTAYYLYKTLKSQKEVQTTQNKLFEIETVRFRESIKPVLKYKISENIITPGEKENSRVYTIEIINETHNTAFEISVDHSEMEGVNRIAWAPQKQNHLKKDEGIYLLHFLIENFGSHHYVIFSISYKDVSGTKYKQGVLLRIDSYGDEINPYLPEILN